MTKYHSNGWFALDGALIFCPNQAQLPITREQLDEASKQRWPGRGTSYYAEESDSRITICIEPEDEYSFVLNLYEGGRLIGMDSTPEFTVRNAAWVRSLMPEDAPRIVVSNSGFDVHAELPFGVTPEEIAATLVDHRVEGWDTDDPDFSTW